MEIVNITYHPGLLGGLEELSVYRVLIKLSGLWVMEFWGFLFLFVFVRQDLTRPKLALLCS